MSKTNKYSALKDLLTHPEFIENNNWSRRTYLTNQTVIFEGEQQQLIYVVLSGVLMVSTDIEITSGGRISPGICELTEGEEFGHFCFFDDAPNCATVKAVSPCEVAVFDTEKLRQFFNQHPDIGYSVVSNWMKNLLPRLRQGNKRIASLFSWGLKAHRIDQELA